MREREQERNSTSIDFRFESSHLSTQCGPRSTISFSRSICTFQPEEIPNRFFNDYKNQNEFCWALRVIQCPLVAFFPIIPFNKPSCACSPTAVSIFLSYIKSWLIRTLNTFALYTVVVTATKRLPTSVSFSNLDKDAHAHTH